MARIVNKYTPKLIRMNSSDPALGIIDSGLGGLSVVQAITALLPYESVVYVGDQAYVPYSDKTSLVITMRVQKMITFLLRKGVKLIVIACNTATVAAIEVMRKIFPEIPIVGVVPVVKTAAEICGDKKFAVLSTAYTANSMYQRKLIAQYAYDCDVLSISCPELVSYIERGDLSSDALRRDLQIILRPVMQHSINTVVLGCTHFPFIRETIQNILGKQVRLLDSGGAVARQVARVLQHNTILALQGTPRYSFYTTGNAADASRVAAELVSCKIRFEHIVVR